MDWNKNKKLRFLTKSISIILIQAFLLYDVTWAIGNKPTAYKLSPPSIFQQFFPDEKSNKFRDSVPSDAKFLNVAFSIGACVLTDNLPVKYVKPVIEEKFSEKKRLLDGFDLNSIKHNDGIVSLNYSKHNKSQRVRICSKEKLNDLDKKRSQWAISDQFAIQIVETEKTSLEDVSNREDMSEEIAVLDRVVIKSNEKIDHLERKKQAVRVRIKALKKQAANVCAKTKMSKTQAYKSTLANLEKQKNKLTAKLEEMMSKKALILKRITVLKEDIKVFGEKIKTIDGAKDSQKETVVKLETMSSNRAVFKDKARDNVFLKRISRFIQNSLKPITIAIILFILFASPYMANAAKFKFSQYSKSKQQQVVAVVERGDTAWNIAGVVYRDMEENVKGKYAAHLQWPRIYEANTQVHQRVNNALRPMYPDGDYYEDDKKLILDIHPGDKLVMPGEVNYEAMGLKVSSPGIISAGTKISIGKDNSVKEKSYVQKVLDGQELKQFEERKETIKKELKDLQDQVHALQDEKKELTAFQNQKRELAKNLKHLNQEKNRLQEDVENLTKKISDAKKVLEETRQKAHQNLKAMWIGLSWQKKLGIILFVLTGLGILFGGFILWRKWSKFKQLSEQEKKLQEDVGNLEKQLTSLREEKNKIEKAKKENEKTKLEVQSKIQEVNLQQERLKEEKTLIKEHAEKLRKEKEKTAKQKQIVAEEMRVLENQRDKLRQKVEDARKESDNAIKNARTRKEQAEQQILRDNQNLTVVRKKIEDAFDVKKQEVADQIGILEEQLLRTKIGTKEGIENAIEKRDSLKKEIADLQVTINALTQQRDKLTLLAKERDQLEESVKTLEKQKMVLLQEKEKRRITGILQHQKEADTQKQEISDLVERKKNILETIETLESRQSEFENTTAELKRGFEEKLKNLKEEENAENVRIQSSRQVMDEDQKMLREKCDKEKQDVLNQIALMNSELKQTKMKHETELLSLKKIKDDAREELEDLSSKKNCKEKELEILQSQTKATKEKLETFKIAMGKKQSEHDNLLQQTRHLQADKEKTLTDTHTLRKEQEQLEKEVEKLKKKGELKPGISHIKEEAVLPGRYPVMIFDIDNTLTDITCDIDSSLLHVLLDFLNDGVRIAFVTVQSFEEVKKHIIKVVPNEKRSLLKNLSVYSSGGAKCSNFSKDGNPFNDRVYDMTTGLAIAVSPNDVENAIRIIVGPIPGIEIRDGLITITKLSNREEVLGRLCALFRKKDWHLVPRLAGGHTIHILIGGVDKAKAATHFVKEKVRKIFRQDIPDERVLVIADSFHKGGLDADIMRALPSANIISVGKKPKDGKLNDLNSKGLLFSEDLVGGRNWRATLEILKEIKKGKSVKDVKNRRDSLWGTKLFGITGIPLFGKLFDVLWNIDYHAVFTSVGFWILAGCIIFFTGIVFCIRMQKVRTIHKHLLSYVGEISSEEKRSFKRAAHILAKKVHYEVYDVYAIAVKKLSEVYLITGNSRIEKIVKLLKKLEQANVNSYNVLRCGVPFMTKIADSEDEYARGLDILSETAIGLQQNDMRIDSVFGYCLEQLKTSVPDFDVFEEVFALVKELAIHKQSPQNSLNIVMEVLKNKDKFLALRQLKVIPKILVAGIQPTIFLVELCEMSEDALLALKTTTKELKKHSFDANDFFYKTFHSDNGFTNNVTVFKAMCNLASEVARQKNNPHEVFTTVVSQAMRTAKDEKAKLIRLNAILQLLLSRIHPTQLLIETIEKTTSQSELTMQINQWARLITDFKTGFVPFNISNPIHVDLEYTHYRKLASQFSQSNTYENYVSIIQQFRADSNQSTNANLSSQEQSEIKLAVYEAYRLLEFIIAIKNKADILGRPVWVVPNLSYGKFAVSPILNELAKLGIEISYAKIGSSASHNHPEFVLQTLFTDDVYRRILKECPIIIVVDGTQHLLARPEERKSSRYPDAYVGYRNFVVALNEVLSNRMDEKFIDKVKIDKDFMSTLRQNPEYKCLADRLRILNNRYAQPALLYNFEFWNPGGLELVVRQTRKEVRNVMPFNPETLDSSVLIFVNSPLLDEDVPAEIKQWANLSQTHVPAFFDDRTQIKQTIFAVNEGGVYLSHALDLDIASATKELKSTYKGKLPQITYSEPTPKDLRNVYEAMLFDLDGTLTDVLCEIDESLLNKLVHFMQSGVLIGIATSQSISEVKKHLIDKVDANDGKALENLVVFTARGAQAWGFDSSKKPYSIYDKSKTDLNDTQRLSVRRIANEALGTLTKSAKVMDRDAQLTISLKSNKDKRDVVNASLKSLIENDSLPFQTEYSGSSTIHVTIKGVNKGAAKDYFLNQILPDRLKHDIDVSKLLIVGDGFHEGGSDRLMIVKGARVVSVGGKNAPKGVETYPTHGWKGTNLLLGDIVYRARKNTMTISNLFICMGLSGLWGTLNDISQSVYIAAKKPFLYISVATLGLFVIFALIAACIKFYKTYRHYASIKGFIHFLDRRDRVTVFKEISRRVTWRRIQHIDSYDMFVKILPTLSKCIANKFVQEMADTVLRLNKIKINPRHVFKYSLSVIASKTKDEEEFIHSLSIIEKFVMSLRNKHYDYHLLLKDTLPQVGISTRNIYELNETLLLGMTLVKFGRNPTFALTRMIPELIALTKTRSEFKIGVYALQELCLQGFEPTKYLLGELVKVRTPAKIVQLLSNWSTTKRKFKTGEVSFNPKNELHINLEYTTFRELVDRTLRQAHRYSFTEYLAILKNFNQRDKSANVSHTEKAEIKFAAYEAFRFRQFVLDVKKQADKMNRAVWVVPNLSYGRFAISPLLKDLAKDGVEIHYARIGSSESHNNPDLVKADLFGAALYDRIINEQPIIIVVDGTQHLLARPKDRKSARYPDAYIGYRNMIIAVNDLLSSGHVQFFKQLVKTHGSFIRHLRKESNFRKLRRRLLRLYRPGANIKRELYDVEFWNPGGLKLVVREARKEVNKVNPILPNKINQPTMIFVNSAMLNEDVPPFIRKWLTNGRKIQHTPAYFDDTSHIQDLIFNVDNSGVSLSDDLNKNVYKEYKRIKDIYRQSFTPPTQPRDWVKLPYKTIISDLDGTLSSTLQKVPKSIIEKLLYLLGLSIQIAIITTQSYEEVEKYLLSQIPTQYRALLQNLSIYSATGSQGFGFDENGKALQKPLYDTTDMKLTNDQVQVWHRTIELLFKEFGLNKKVKDKKGQIIATPVKVIDAGSQIIIRLKERGHLRREIGKRLKLALTMNALPITLKEIGHTSIRMTIRGIGKSNAVKYHLTKLCKAKFGAKPKPEEVLILGNSFDKDGDDRDMMVKGAKVFSLGHKPIQHHLKSGINFYPVYGWEGSDQLLSEFINMLQVKLPKVLFKEVRLSSLKPRRDVEKYLTKRIEAIKQKYPGVRIGVIGAVAPTRMYRSILGEQLGKILREHVSNKGFVFTGGVSGVGVDVYRGVVEGSNGKDDRFFVLLPEGMSAGRDYRKISPAKKVCTANLGEGMLERRMGMGRVSSLLIVLNGSNGTLHEAVSALQNGKKIIALDYGGAGSLLYDAKIKNELSKTLIFEGLKTEHLDNIIPADITDIEEILAGEPLSFEDKRARMERELTRLTLDLHAIDEEMTQVQEKKNKINQKIKLLNRGLENIEKNTWKARSIVEYKKEVTKDHAVKNEINQTERLYSRIKKDLQDLQDVKKVNENKLKNLREQLSHIGSKPKKKLALQEEKKQVSIIDEAKVHADNFVNSIVARAMAAKKLGQKLIIGLDTSWIPGYEEGQLQHMALNPLIRELKKLERRMNNLGLNNIVIEIGSRKDLANKVLLKAQTTNTPLSNIIILTGQSILTSGVFDSLKSTKNQRKAFIAVVNTSKLDEYYNGHPQDSRQSYMRLMEMLNIAMELSMEKESLNNPMIISYDRNTRMVILQPKAEPIDFTKMKKLYDAQKQAIIAA